MYNVNGFRKQSSQLKGCFHGARKRFAKDANVENLHSHFRLQKFAKHARGFGSVTNCSWESFLVRREFQTSLKFFANVSSIPGRDLLVTYSRSAWCSQTLCETPSRFHQFGECFAHVSRKQRSWSDHFSTYMYSRTVRVLLLIRLPFATINLRMSQSIPELFASYTQTKTDAFMKIWRRFCTHDILTWPLADIKCMAEVLFAF